MSTILEECESYGLKMIRYGEGTTLPTKYHAMHSSRYSSLTGCYLICEKLATLELTTSYHEGKPTTYICSLNEQNIVAMNGQKAYMQFQKVAKIPSLKKLGLENLLHQNSYDGKYAQSSVPCIGVLNHERAVLSNVYEYDINSAYASVIVREIPSFSEIEYNRVVKEGEIGFLLNENLSLCHFGEFAEVICKLIPTPKPLKEYIYKWYQKKKEGDKEAKCMLNFPIGYFQRTNPFFRAYVVNSCNERIQRLINEDIFMWNTDAIYSTKKLDLKIGNGIGEWKEIPIKKIQLLGLNYQIDDEPPSYRGIPKYWFEQFKKEHGRPFDLTLDKIPNRVNKWVMNWNKMKLEELQ